MKGTRILQGGDYGTGDGGGDGWEEGRNGAPGDLFIMLIMYSKCSDETGLFTGD